MLYVTATNDKGCLNSLSTQIFGKEFDGGVGYVMYDDGTPVGVAKLNVTEEESHLISLGIVPSARKKGYGDFFTRVLMDTASNVSEDVYIDYQSDYFLKFGFMKVESGMKIHGEDIVFPSSCHHNAN